MTLRFQTAAITDEFSDNLDTALDAMAALGMSGVELRVVFGKNVIDLSDDEIDAVMVAVRRRGMSVVSIASPLLKCRLPDAPPLDVRFQQDLFKSAYAYDDQPRLAQRAFRVAQRTGAPLIRAFSYWRTIEPLATFDRVLTALHGLADEAQQRGVIVGLENEHACNVATGAEAAHVLAALHHPALQIVWDPANALVAGERPYPYGYQCLPIGRIAHVHVKDCRTSGSVVTWGLVGDMEVDWSGQLGALVRDGYRGWLSLETHWRGRDGDALGASMLCGQALQTLVREHA